MTAIWLTMLVAGVLTYLIRLSFIGILGRWQPPAWARRALRFVPPAVLSAIVFPEVLVREGAFALLNPRLGAALLAAVVAWWTKSAILAIVAGMGALLVIQALGG